MNYKSIKNPERKSDRVLSKSIENFKALKLQQTILFWAALIPPIVLGFLVWRYSINVPFWDQWETPGRLFIEAAEDKLTWAQWMRQHNESRTLFPNFIFLTLANLTNWNTRYEMLVTFLLACWVSCNIYYLSKIALGNNRQHLVCFLIANLLIFSPIQYENWLWGFQGITFSSIVAITTSLVVIYSSASWVLKLIISSVLSAIATFSFANGVLCWIIIFPALLLKSIQDKVKKIWVICFWLLATTATMTIYLYGYSRPSDLPSVTQIFTSPILAISYYSALLGSPLFAQDFLGSQITGLVAIFIFACFCFYLLFSEKNILVINQYCPWLLIGLYVLCSAVLTTAGRMSISLEASQSSRYITFTTYLVVAFIYLFALTISRLRRKIVLKIIAGLLGIVLLITHKDNFVLGTEIMTKSHYQRVYGKTCLLTIDLIGDKDCIATYIHPIPDTVEKQAKKIDRIGFLQPGLLAQIDWQTPVVKSKNNITNKYGEFNDFYLTEDGSYTASGYTFAISKKPSLDAIILTYQTKNQPPTAFAIAELNLDNRDLWRLLLNPRKVKLTWSKTFERSQLPPKDSNINAWAFDTNDAKAYPLQRVRQDFSRLKLTDKKQT